MKNKEFEPLGLSDLTEDEALLVSIFRDWRGLGPTRSIAEHRLAISLKNDRFFKVLEPLFDVFKTVSVRDDLQQGFGCPLLSPVEETLLNEIGFRGAGQQPALDNLQTALHAVCVRIRPAYEIPRSGHDRLIQAINDGSARVMQALHPTA